MGQRATRVALVFIPRAWDEHEGQTPACLEQAGDHQHQRCAVVNRCYDSVTAAEESPECE